VRRRDLLAMLGGIAIAWPRAARAQKPAMPVIGYLGNGKPSAVPSRQRETFRQSLRALGWIEGQNVTIESRWAEGNPDRLPALVAELVEARVDVLMLAGPSAIRAAQGATRTVPIVFVVLTDPVTAGFVKSLARPGGNMTGLASEFEELITKQLQLLKETVPSLSRVALLHSRDSEPSVLGAAESATRSLGLKAQTLTVARVAEFARAECGAAKVVLGGRSMGGRMASQAVAKGLACDGLAFLAYPLHPPGQESKLRDAHQALLA